jgi:hypothetical protein
VLPFAANFILNRTISFGREEECLRFTHDRKVTLAFCRTRASLPTKQSGQRMMSTKILKPTR